MAEMRIVQQQTGILPKSEFLNRVPKDFFDLSSQSGIEEFVSAFREGKLDQGSEDDDWRLAVYNVL